MNARRVQLSATVSPDAAGLDDVHALLDRFWRECSPGSEADRLAVEIALAEIAGNVVRHGAGAPYTVRLARDGIAVVAEVDEPGRRLAADIVDTCALPGDDAEGGRGLALARAAVDDLDYRHDGGTNHWTIRRVVSGSPD